MSVFPILAILCLPCSLAVAWAAREIALRRQLLDSPNERSAHVRPTPRLGGVGIMVAFLGASSIHAGMTERPELLVVIAATGAIAAVGFADDLRPIPARIRFVIQILLGSVVVFSRGHEMSSGLGPLQGWPALISGPFAVLFIVWLTNLYNFMDGIDGLAGGQAVFAATALAACAFSGGASDAGWLAVYLGLACAGFLFLNFPPASIFMGDAGSTAIGFFFACFPMLPGAGAPGIDVVAFALSLFILDATTTLVRRVLKGERWFEAHRSHWYQRPLALGVSHRRIALIAYGGMICVAIGAIAYGRLSAALRVPLWGGPVVAFSALAGWVLWLERAAREPRGAETRPS